MSLSSSFKPLLERWSGLSSRERHLIQAGAAALALLLVWSLALKPAWVTLREAPARRAELGARAERMQAWAAEAAALQGMASAQTGAVREPKGPEGGLDDALRAELRSKLGESCKVEAQGRQVLVTFDAASGEQVRATLRWLRSHLKARLVEAELVPGQDGLQGRLRLEWQPA